MLIRVRGVDLYVDVASPELAVEGGRLHRRPIVIVLHGGPGFDHGYLKPAMAPIREWAQVVFVDLRGQGRSQRVDPATITLDTMADDVAAVCTALGIERPIILGHSVGGYVALTLALRHPHRVGGLLLANAAARFDLAANLALLEQHHGAVARDIAAAVFNGDFSPAVLGRYLDVVLPTYTHASTTAALSDFALSGFDPEVTRSFFVNCLPGYDLRPHLSSITVRALVLTGDSDWLTPPAFARETAEAMANAELAILPQTGHFACNERPAIVAAMAYRSLVAV